MFKNPGGKLKVIIKIAIIFMMSMSIFGVSAVLLAVRSDSIAVVIYWLFAVAVIVLVWWIIGLSWLLKVDMADNLSKIQESIERMERRSVAGGCDGFTTPAAPRPAAPEVRPKPSAYRPVSVDHAPTPAMPEVRPAIQQTPGPIRSTFPERAKEADSQEL